MTSFGPAYSKPNDLKLNLYKRSGWNLVGQSN